MLHKTKGIALKTTSYAESSIVAHVYTELLGMQAYLINGAKKPKAKIHASLFQPLHPLEMVVYHKDTNGLQRIKEAQQVPVLKHIPLDIIKSSMALFLNEVLYKALKKQSPDPFLFQFVQQSIAWLDETESNLANFHLIFLIKLSRFLGFLPLQSAGSPMPYFDMLEGVFLKNLPAHSHVLQPPHTQLLYLLLQSTYTQAAELKIGKEDRKFLLEKLLEFYKLHTENFGTIHALYVLEEIFQ